MPSTESRDTNDTERGGGGQIEDKTSSKTHISFTERIDHFTWSWGTFPMCK